MSNIVKINGTDLQVIEYKGQRVATLGQVDAVHERPEGTARRTFNDHKHRLVEGEDFFVCNTSEAKALGVTAPNGLVVMTERGYTMLVKPFTDDLAWEVQRMVVTGYFHGKKSIENAKPARAADRYRDAAVIAQASIRLCKLMGVETNMARVITADLVSKESGVDCTPMLAGNIAVQDVPVTPSKIGEAMDPPISGKKVNAMLIELGLQTKDAAGEYHLTEAGKAFGVTEPFKSRNSAHVGHCLKWYTRVAEPLAERFSQQQSNVVQLQGTTA